MSIHDDAHEHTSAETELTRRRGDPRRVGDRPPEVGERRANDRRKPPGFKALISALFGRN